MSRKPAPAAVSVVSESCTTYFPDLGLELPAGVPVEVSPEQLERILAMPGVVQIPTTAATSEE